MYSLRSLPRPQVGVEEEGDSQLQGVDAHGIVLGAINVFLSWTRQACHVNHTQGHHFLVATCPEKGN